MRTFIAVELPESVKDSIIGLSKELGACNVRLVDREAMHITLCFLGEVQESKIEEIKRAMEEVKVGPFDVALGGVSTFNPDSPRVLFADVRTGGGRLKEIYKTLNRGLGAVGIEFESREYVPHMTIARVRDPRRSRECLGKFMKSHDEGFGDFVCDRIALKKSAFTEGGVVHSTLYEKRLLTG